MTVKPINLTEDKPALSALWRTAFPEDGAFGDLFLTEALPPAAGWGCYVDERPVSMAFLLPADLHIEDSTLKAQYVYGVATLPQYRGRGYASTLMNALIQHTDADILYLYPATDEAKRLYKKLGYRDVLRRKTVDFCSISSDFPLKNLRFYPFFAEKYVDLRQKYRQNTAFCYADFPEKLLNILLANAILLEFDGGFALMHEDENNCILSEAVTIETLLPALLSALHDLRPDKRIQARLPGGTEGAGMLLPLTEKGRSLTDSFQSIAFGGPLFDL